MILSMADPTIAWQCFPKSKECPRFLLQVLDVFKARITEINSAGHEGQASNDVLAHLREGFEALGFKVETGKGKSEKIKVPVLYGKNGTVEKYFEADAHNPIEKVVIEVEAGRGVTNYQFLKDLFQASVMQDVDHLVIAVRQDYRGSDDFEKVITFMETLYASDRLILPLKAIVIVGY